jgi:murein DD-endopeptidase MepM/ murein hydrolase activator NlpD
VDLVSPLGSAASEIVAPVGGDAYIFDGCDERNDRPDAHNDSRCGLGYGNHVKIWDGTNIYLLGHLSQIRVQQGRVAPGQVIGVEGVSGAAGHRHVHLTVTRPGTDDDVRHLLSTPGFKGPTPVRFRVRLRDEAAGTTRELWVDELDCREHPANTTMYAPGTVSSATLP